MATGWSYSKSRQQEESCLRRMMSECTAEQFLSTAKTLLQIMMRVAGSRKDDDEARRVRKRDATFSRNVWRWPVARDFLEATGWVELSESLILPTYIDVAETCRLLQNYISCNSGSTASRRHSVCVGGHSTSSAAASSRSSLSVMATTARRGGSTSAAPSRGRAPSFGGQSLLFAALGNAFRGMRDDVFGNYGKDEESESESESEKSASESSSSSSTSSSSSSEDQRRRSSSRRFSAASDRSCRSAASKPSAKKAPTRHTSTRSSYTRSTGG